MKKNALKKFFALSLASAMGVSMLAGCGSTESKPADNQAATEAAGGEEANNEAAESTNNGPKEIIIGSGQTCSTLNVVNSYDGWYAVRFGIAQTLTKMNDDMTISCWLVNDDYTVSEDYKTWTFTIKDGVTFSSGKACDAAAVKASLENVFENGTRGPEYFTPESIEADGQTLTITCEHAEPILINKLADPLFCIVDAEDPNLETMPSGTGPFVYESFDDTSKECVVVKNNNYWNGEVKTDKITFIYTEDQPALSMAMQTGEFDAVYNLSMAEIGNYENNPDYVISRKASGRTTHGFMNQHGALADAKLRQAILKALDRETFVNVLLNGQYVAGKTLITSSASYGYADFDDPYAFDIDGAVALLDEAGYKDVDGDGYRETPDGQPLSLSFVYYQGRPEQQVLVEATEQELSKVGIKITIELYDSATVMNKLMAGEYDLLCMSINVLNCADPENHLKTYFGTGGSYASSGFDNAEYDAILEELAVTADPQGRIDLVKQAEKILLDEAAVIPFCYPLMNFVMKKNVSGIESTPADYYWVSEATDIN